MAAAAAAAAAAARTAAGGAPTIPGACRAMLADMDVVEAPPAANEVTALDG
jgi:hypothetical protein